ncbi:MAG: hypothetical protein H0V09_01845 [Gemmatimonadetes bacterium]|nr:hypothetical protein [Gemmatimonadota bacterium]
MKFTRALGLSALLTCCIGPRMSAQEYVVAVAEENFRAGPNGAKLGTLKRGASLDAVGERGRWVKASLAGWIWGRSVKASRGTGGLVVSVASENLRSSPAPRAQLLGTVLRGTTLRKTGSRGGWHQVVYDGWIWQPSLAAEDVTAPRAESPEATTSTSSEKSPRTRGKVVADLTVSAAEENLRVTPGGKRLGELRQGADLRALSSSGEWREVAVRGWFWGRSASGRGSTRRVAVAVENLRIAPGSEIIGVLERGAPLQVIGTAGAWLEVELEAWIWGPSTLDLSRRRLEPDGAAKPPNTGSPRAEPRGAEATDRSDVIAAASRSLSRSVPLKDGPGGTLIGEALTGSSVVPLRSDGDWVKVRIEGWVPRDALAGTTAGGAPTVSMVVADPARFKGRETTWRLELIAIARADRSRPDFAPGESYLLTRNAGGEREYVYVVIPERLLATFRGMQPFAPLTMRGVVRTGRSALVGNPILELRELVRERG